MARGFALAALFLANALACAPAQATCASGDAARCLSRRSPDGSVVTFPRLHWNPIASAERSPHGQGFDFRYLQGGMTRVTRHASALALGLPGQQVSGVFYQAPGSPPIVFARFAPGSNQLRIDILRIERGGDGRITVANAVFGPHHGERFLAQPDVLGASTVGGRAQGINPLAAWKSPQDNIFHDICFECPGQRGGIDPSTSGVATALGIAMRSVGAHLGILAVAREWIDVQEDSSGGLLWSTVTVKVSGYAKPEWWIASPIGAQMGGTSTLGICAVAGETPCRPEHVVLAGIQLAPWSGPNLPTDQDRLYYSENSQSGFTVLGYSLITAALVGFGSYVWGGELVATDGAAGATFSTNASGGLVGGSAALNGIVGGTSYIGFSDALHPSSPTQIQQGFLGSTVSSGKLTAEIAGDAATQSLQTATNHLQIESELGMALTGVRRAYQGDCAAATRRSDCKATQKGQVPRIGDKTH